MDRGVRVLRHRPHLLRLRARAPSPRQGEERTQPKQPSLKKLHAASSHLQADESDPRTYDTCVASTQALERRRKTLYEALLKLKEG